MPSCECSARGGADNPPSVRSCGARPPRRLHVRHDAPHGVRWLCGPDSRDATVGSNRTPSEALLAAKAHPRVASVATLYCRGLQEVPQPTAAFRLSFRTHRTHPRLVSIKRIWGTLMADFSEEEYFEAQEVVTALLDRREI